MTAEEVAPAIDRATQLAGAQFVVIMPFHRVVVGVMLARVAA